MNGFDREGVRARSLGKIRVMDSATETDKTNERSKILAHQEIETVALYHWKDRMELGILGDAVSDWY